MRLELYLRGHLLDSIEFSLPAYDRLFDFESNVDNRELCVKRMIKLIKKNNERAIENKEWVIYLFIPVTEEILEPETKVG